MKLRHGMAAGAGIFMAVAVGVALQSGQPAKAVGPPADGTYSFNEAGVSGVTWTISALCDQPSGTRNMNDYSDPIVFAMNVGATSSLHAPSVIPRPKRSSGTCWSSSTAWP